MDALGDRLSLVASFGCHALPATQTRRHYSIASSAAPARLWPLAWNPSRGSLPAV